MAQHFSIFEAMSTTIACKRASCRRNGKVQAAQEVQAVQEVQADARAIRAANAAKRKLEAPEAREPVKTDKAKSEKNENENENEKEKEKEKENAQKYELALATIAALQSRATHLEKQIEEAAAKAQAALAAQAQAQEARKATRETHEKAWGEAFAKAARAEAEKNALRQAHLEEARPEPKQTKRRVSKAVAMWQEDEAAGAAGAAGAADAAKARNTGDMRLSFSWGAPGRFSGVAAVEKAAFDGVMLGICEPIVVRVQRADSNGPQSPILRCVEERIYLKAGEELGKPLVELLAEGGDLDSRELAHEFDGLMEARERVRFELDVEACINEGAPYSPSWGWITRRVWVPEDSRAAAMLRALIDAAEAKAKAKAEADAEAEAAALESPSYGCCSPKHHEPSQHYEPSQPAYSATSPNYNPRAPCYSGSRPTAWSPTAPRYSPNSPQQEPNSPMS